MGAVIACLVGWFLFFMLSVPSPPVKEVLTSRYRGDLYTARQLCDDWLKKAERIKLKSHSLQLRIAATQEMLADCTLYGRDSDNWQYEFHVEKAEELYDRAMKVTNSDVKKSILNSKLAILQMINGSPLKGLRTLEEGTTPTDLKSTLFFEVAQGIGNRYIGETFSDKTSSEWHQLLCRALDVLHLNSRSFIPKSVFPSNDPWEQEHFELQLLCIHQLLSVDHESRLPEFVQRDVAASMDLFLLGTIVERSDLHPYLRKDFARVIQYYQDNLPKQVKYIHYMRGDSLLGGSARLIFYFTNREGFAIFLSGNMSQCSKFELGWTRKDLLDKQTHLADEGLDEQLLALLQAEWDAGRRVTLSWCDDMYFPPGEGLSHEHWPFESQLKWEDFNHSKSNTK